MGFQIKMLSDENKSIISHIGVLYKLYGRHNTFQTFNPYLLVPHPLMNCKMKNNGDPWAEVTLSKEALYVLEQFQKDLIETAELLIAEKTGDWNDCALGYLETIAKRELVINNQLKKVHIYDFEVLEKLKKKGESYADIILRVLPLYDCTIKMSYDIVLLED
jgi:hypothetical protein